MKNSENPVTIPAWAVGMQIVGALTTGSGVVLKTTAEGFNCTISYYPMRSGGECDVEITPVEAPARLGHAQVTPTPPGIHGMNLKNIPEACVLSVILEGTIPHLVSLRTYLLGVVRVADPRGGRR